MNRSVYRFMFQMLALGDIVFYDRLSLSKLCSKDHFDIFYSRMFYNSDGQAYNTRTMQHWTAVVVTFQRCMAIIRPLEARQRNKRVTVIIGSFIIYNPRKFLFC